MTVRRGVFVGLLLVVFVFGFAGSYWLMTMLSQPVTTVSPLPPTCIPALPATPVPAPTEVPKEDACGIEYVLGTEDTLSPYASKQVMVRESMVSGVRADDTALFCDSYLEFLRIGKEDSFISVIPGGEELVLGEKDGWMIRLLMIDWYLIPDLVELSGLCSEEEG